MNAHFLHIARRNREAGLPKLLLLHPLGRNFICYYGVKIQQSRTPRSIWYQKIKFLKHKEKLRKPTAAFQTVTLKLDSEISNYLFCHSAYLGWCRYAIGQVVTGVYFLCHLTNQIASTCIFTESSTLLHYGSLPFTSIVGSESRPSSHGIFVTWP